MLNVKSDKVPPEANHVYDNWTPPLPTLLSCNARRYSHTKSTILPRRGRWAQRAGWLGLGVSPGRWRSSGRRRPAPACSPVGRWRSTGWARARRPTRTGAWLKANAEIQVWPPLTQTRKKHKKPACTFVERQPRFSPSMVCEANQCSVDFKPVNTRSAQAVSYLKQGAFWESSSPC